MRKHQLKARFGYAAAAAVLAVAVGGLGASTASASGHTTFCTNVLLPGAGTCKDSVFFTTGVTQVNADAISSAKPCATWYYSDGSLRGQNCSETEGARVTYYLPQIYTSASVGVHNHSTHQGRFNASADGA